MNKELKLKDAEAIKSLASKLSKCKHVTRFDTREELEAWTLSHAFSDLEESFHRFLYELLPRLIDSALDENAINDVLLDIGEEFRHILYHIKDPKFYEYLQDNSEER